MYQVITIARSLCSYEVKPPTVENPVNFVHYDPEMHWCQTCQVFPKTAKDFLTHLHSKDHQEMQKTIESPWHDHPQNDVRVLSFGYTCLPQQE